MKYVIDEMLEEYGIIEWWGETKLNKVIRKGTVVKTERAWRIDRRIHRWSSHKGRMDNIRLTKGVVQMLQHQGGGSVKNAINKRGLTDWKNFENVLETGINWEKLKF